MRFVCILTTPSFIVDLLSVLSFIISSVFILLNVLNRYLVSGFLRELAKVYEGLRPAYFLIRDTLGDIVVTADEVPGLLLVWVAYLGAYTAMRKEGHIAFELGLNSLPRKFRRFFQAINTLLIIGFLTILFWQSIRMIRFSGSTEIETAAIAQGWFMSILPLAALLLIFSAVSKFIAGIKTE